MALNKPASPVVEFNRNRKEGIRGRRKIAKRRKDMLMSTETPTSVRRQYAWLSALNILLGAWLIVSPFVLPFHHLAAAVWNDVVAGILIGLVALIRASISRDEPGLGWCNTVLGTWVVVSPFVLGFASTPRGVRRFGKSVPAIERTASLARCRILYRMTYED
jgi:VIT1/CCC1 family predicted Fe2+/Mn2+ transporter